MTPFHGCRQHLVRVRQEGDWARETFPTRISAEPKATATTSSTILILQSRGWDPPAVLSQGCHRGSLTLPIERL